MFLPVLLAGALHHSGFPLLCYLCCKCVLLGKEDFFPLSHVSDSENLHSCKHSSSTAFEVDSIIFKAKDQ